MKKRVFIIHGWSGNPDEHWLPWLADELEKRGYEVQVPQMPRSDEPNIQRWVSCLTGLVGKLDEQTFFVGHSIGCQAILRYLETEVGSKAGGCVFVAGWFKLENLESAEEERIAEPWMQDDINFAEVLQVTPNFIVINSSNDDYGAIEENKRMFEEKLHAKVHILENRGHFTESDGATQLSEALEATLGL